MQVSVMQRAIAVLLLPLLFGCTAFSGYPDRVTEPAQDLAALQKSIDADRIVACLALEPQQAGRDCRNQLVSARVYAVDLQFSQFEERLFRQTATMVTASVRSTLVVAAAQGILCGLAFWIVGLSSPVFWAVVAMVCCLLPVGAWIVWAPAASCPMVQKCL